MCDRVIEKLKNVKNMITYRHRNRNRIRKLLFKN